MTARSLGLCLLFAVLLGGNACQLFRSAPKETLSAEELRDLLAMFIQRLVNDVDSTTDVIMANTTDRAIKERALRWKISMVDVGQDAMLTEPPTAAFLDMWTLTVQSRNYLETSGGGMRFGELGQPLAIDVVRRAETVIEDIGHQLLTPERWQQTHDEVLQFAEENPFTIVRGRVTNRPSVVAQAEESTTFTDILELPLAPFRAFGGIDNAAAAVRDFASVADRFTTVVQSLPEQMRWQMALLLYDVEDRETVQALVDSLDEGAESMARFTDTAEQLTATAGQLAATADRLPDDLRSTLLSSIDAVTAAQPELQRTLAEARATAEALDGAARSLQGAVGEGAVVGHSLELAAQRVAEAGVAWEATGRAFGLSGDEQDSEPAPAADGEQQPGFDIEAYGVSAEKLTEAAVQIRALVEQIDALLASDHIERVEASTAMALQTTTVEARSLADHVAWRALQVLLAALAALLVYRVLAARFVR